ncbi:hypothetical protein RDWZM_006936 [Blomia tropicalis]|uniref:Anillin homology domain-containing protein n=1 Tax=Blomia tropicalis TaxID=40697 RepID=A0A9Q0RNU1_BLOTA|nr:hypothetical protein RDWZM_006936 [Blomia tropicalis]
MANNNQTMNTLNETNIELDSFTADMIKKVKDFKNNMDRMLDDNDDLFDEKAIPVDNDMEKIKMMKKNQIRKSISALLNVSRSILDLDKCGVDQLPSDDNISDNEPKGSRLNRRLQKLSQLYIDEDAPSSNVLTENKVNIQNETDYKPKPLKEKLNDIARFYYPIEDDEFPSKSKQTKDSKTVSIKTNKETIKPIDSNLQSTKSESAVVKPTVKFQDILQRIKSAEIENSSSKTIPKPIIVNTIAKANEQKTEPVKKTSVADLKKIFEEKSIEMSQVKEVAPELLSIKQKRRLFEKAIREETEASKNQYPKRTAPPLKRISNWEPITNVEIKKQKSSPELEKSEMESKKCSPTDSTIYDQVVPMSLCSVNSIEQDEEVEEPESMVENISEVVEEESEIIEEHSSPETLDKALEDIDNLTYDAVESKIHSISDITFSEIDSDDSNIQRCSTKAELSTDSCNSKTSSLHESSISLCSEMAIGPEKPPRLYLYENQDEPEVDSPIGSSNQPPPIDEVPQMRTISFYRREKQKRLEILAQSPGDNVIHIKQNLKAKNVVDIKEFVANCEERIASLKNEISEHNRISSQACTALNMCLTHSDLVFSEGRIEAERLSLIAAEKRNACMIEIQKLKSMIKNPDQYSSRMSKMTSKGMVHISNLCIPLRTDFVELRAKGKVTTENYFICLIFNGPKVFVSELLNTHNNLGQDFLEFKFGLTCQELSEDFTIRIQLFNLMLNKDKPKKSHIAKSFRIKFGTSSLKRNAKLDTNVVDSPVTIKNMNMANGFKPIGHVNINLATLRKPLSFYQLESYSMGVPIDGYLTMDLKLKVKHNFNVTGFFDLQEYEDSFWNLRWFVMDGSRLMFWRFQENLKTPGSPLGVIDLKHCVNPCVQFLKGEQKNVCVRPNTFILVTIKPPSVSNAHKLLNGGTIAKPVPKRYFISSQSKEDCTFLCEQVNNALRNIRAWEIDAVQPYSMEEFNRLILSA